MCTSSYKPPKAQPVPAAPPAPTEGAQAPVINDGSPGGAVAKLQALAQSANSLVVPFTGKRPMNVDEIQAKAQQAQVAASAASFSTAYRRRGY